MNSPDQTRFLCISYRNWLIAFSVLNFLIFILMAASIGISKWVYTDIEFKTKNLRWNDKDNNLFKGKEFEGSLFKCNVGCDASWEELATEWCKFYSDFDDDFENTDDPDLLESSKQICSIYKNLYVGSSCYLYFELTAIISMIFLIYAILNSLKSSIHYLKYSIVCSAVIWVFHIIAFSVFVAMNNLSYLGRCDKLENDGTKFELCASDGSYLALVNTAFMTLVVVAFWIVGCKMHHRNKAKGIKKVMDELHDNEKKGDDVKIENSNSKGDGIKDDYQSKEEVGNIEKKNTCEISGDLHQGLEDDNLAIITKNK